MSRKERRKERKVKRRERRRHRNEEDVREVKSTVPPHPNPFSVLNHLDPQSIPDDLPPPAPNFERQSSSENTLQALRERLDDLEEVLSATRQESKKLIEKLQRDIDKERKNLVEFEKTINDERLAIHNGVKDLIARLELEKQQQEEKQTAFQLPECTVCLDEEPDQLLAPCGHVILCEGCSQDVLKQDARCPTCRTPIEHIYKVFLH